jgi:xanthine phosphoribosyltransferase
MHALRERILRDGKHLGSGILKVDGFINHRVDPGLMFDCGRQLAACFREVRASKVLTAEASGIGPALATAFHLGVPLVFAKKKKPITMPSNAFVTVSPSHTKGVMIELIVSPEYLQADDRVLIVDDFLASGTTVLALARLADAAGATVAGVGALIEKGFEGGRAALAHLRVPVRALVCVASLDEHGVRLADDQDAAGSSPAPI